MKHLISRLTTTVKALQLLSDPYVVESLYAEIKTKKEKATASKTSSKLGRNDAYYHKHFIVQVLN